MSVDSLGDRMKNYESAQSTYLTRRTPVIIRLDMCHGHTFCRGLGKPWDEAFSTAMVSTAVYLCEEVQGCKMAYTQSDEISLLLTDYDTIKTDAWFNNRLQKIVSVSASLATLAFNISFAEFVANEKLNFVKNVCSTYENIMDEIDKSIYKNKVFSAVFDSRAFNLPKEEVINYFIWRQNDATRNSILGLGQSQFGHKELMNKKCSDIQDMLMLQKNINWNNIPTWQKRGCCAIKDENNKWFIDADIPVFTADRGYIEKLLVIEDAGC